jgi:TorA maturation chaperone TorD
MTLQVQSSVTKEPYQAKETGMNETLELIDENGDVAGAEEIELEQQHRASAYSLIAALLRASPDQSLLNTLTELAPEKGFSNKDDSEDDNLMLAMSTISLSAKMSSPESIEDEYHNLFIGLGKGEVVPYGSWYLTGFLMEKPLSDLRDDLAALGYEKNDDVSEPEDHAAALCEVFSLLIGEGCSLDQQRLFFKAHMEPWMAKFFNDLAEAKSAIFYKGVGRFGAAFITLETEYFSMQT